MSVCLSRRSFLRSAVSSSALGFSVPRSIDAVEENPDDAFDIVIQGGIVYDGSGAPGVPADVGIKGNLIAEIGKPMASKRAKKVIDAQGCAVTPGFIDPHTHTDSQLFENPRAESAVHQGVTTQISGNCGSSSFLTSVAAAGRELRSFYSRLESRGIAINYATLAGHGALRTYAMGTHDRAPSTAELKRMKNALRDTLEAGGMGLSTGLWYAPGSFAHADEIVELSSELAPFDAVYATHIRDEGDAVVESVREVVDIASRSGARLQISHLKTMYPRNHAKLPAVLDAIESGVRRGVRIMADRYPYIASSTSLSVFFPRWSQEGSTADFLGRIRDHRYESRFLDHFAEIERKIVSWDTITICSVRTAKNRQLEGTTVFAAAKASGKSPFAFIRDLLLEEENRVDIVNFAMNEDNLKKILAHPLTMIGSDGYAFAPYGKLGSGKPHPRSYGTFARVLGKYVRDEKVLDLSSAIRKMTSMSAGQFGLKKRGLLKEGYYADIAVFDPETIKDRAEWTNPHRYADGISYVLVNGTTVIAHGKHTGALPGRCLIHDKE